MGIQRTVVPVIIISPHLGNQLFTLQCNIPVPHQIKQQVVFFRRKFGALSIHRHSPSGKINDKPLRLENLMPVRACRISSAVAVNDHFYTHHKLLRRKRLHHIIVNSKFKSVNLIILFSACRQHDHRNVFGLADLPAG